MAGPERYASNACFLKHIEGRTNNKIQRCLKVSRATEKEKQRERERERHTHTLKIGIDAVKVFELPFPPPRPSTFPGY